MSFIELTRHTTGGITVNTEHIVTFSTTVGELRRGEVLTEIGLAAGSPHAPSRILVRESYAEVRQLVGLGVAE